MRSNYDKLKEKASMAYMDDDWIKEEEENWYKVPNGELSDKELEDDVIMLEEIDQVVADFDQATQQESYESPSNEVSEMIGIFEGIINDNLEKQAGMNIKACQTPSDWEVGGQDEFADEKEESFIQLFPLILLMFLTLHDGLICSIFLVKPIFWFRFFHGVGHAHVNFVYRAMAYYATTFIIQCITIYKTQQNIPKVSPILSYRHRIALKVSGELALIEKRIAAYQHHMQSKSFCYMMIGSLRLADVLTHGAYFYASSSITLMGRLYLSFAGLIFGYITYYFLTWKPQK